MTIRNLDTFRDEETGKNYVVMRPWFFWVFCIWTVGGFIFETIPTLLGWVKG